MAYGRRFDEWDRASLLAALINNTSARDQPHRTPQSFNPFLPDEAKADNCVMKITDPRAIAHLLGGSVQVIQ